MRGVQANGENIKEDDIEDIVWTCLCLILKDHTNPNLQVGKVREKHDREYVAKRQEGKPSKSKVC